MSTAPSSVIAFNEWVGSGYCNHWHSIKKSDSLYLDRSKSIHHEEADSNGNYGSWVNDEPGSFCQKALDQ